jgi:uncharacterized protein YodC (DUF2158 family)
MATKFQKGQQVKVKAVIPTGPIQAFRMREDGVIFCLVQWVDDAGITQIRWFKEDDLVEA